MRGLKSTLVLAALLAGLVSYIYFVDAKRPEGGSEAKAKAFTVQADQIAELRVKTAGETSYLRKADDGWEIVEPIKARADDSELSSVTSNLASVEIQRVVDENPGDLAQYGLNPPRVDVAFRLDGEKEFRHLYIGEKTPTGGDLYAKMPDEKRVFLIASFLDSTFNRTAFDFRDKRILQFDREKVDGLELAHGSTNLRLTRSGTDWKIVEPFTARADYGAIEGLVTRLSTGQMQKIVADGPDGAKQYGLAAPVATATVTSGSAKASLALGKTEGESVYARDLSRPMIFAVEQSLLTDVQKDPAEFRNKDLFDFRSFSANRVEVRRGDGRFTFVKTRDKDGNDLWRAEGGKNVDASKLGDMLTKFSNLRASSIDAVKHASLQNPELTFTATFADGKKQETVTFGRSGQDVFASRADEPGSAKIDTTGYEDALKALDALK